MPSLIGSLFVSLTADFASFQRNMRSAEGVVASTATGMRRHMGLTEKSVTSFQRSVGQGVKPYALISAARAFDTVQQRANLLRGALFATTAAFGGLGAALTTNVVSRYLDQFTGLENQMRVVASGSADLAAKMSAVQDVAARSRASLAAVATLYSRISKASPNEAPQAILRRVETINKALQLGGATAQEAASAAIQFSQAIASNRLGGEELRAVLETPLGMELAKGLGVSIGEFRKMGTAGELTAEVLFKALDKISKTIDGQFAQSLSTIDQALTTADGQITAYAGSLDDAYGITKLLTSSIKGFGNNLETIVPILATFGATLGTVFAARRAGGVANFLGTPFAATARIKAERRENLRLAKEGVALAERAQREAADRITAARGVVTGGNVLGMAPKSEIKAYQRDLAALEKADAKHLDLLHQKAVITTRLGEVYKATTVGELRAATALADQQTKLNTLYSEQRRIKQAVRKADTAVTGGAGLSSQVGGTLRTQTDAQKTLNEAIKQQGVIAKAITTEEQRLGAMRQTIRKEEGASFLRAADERAAILVKEKAVTQDLIRSDQQRADLINKARVSRGVATDSGIGVAGKALSEAERAASGAERSIFRARDAMLSAGRAAGFMSTSLGLARAAGGSLVGFLGGPWGVAFTAAIAALTLFGIRSRAAAEEIALAQQLMEETLARAAEKPSALTVPETETLLEKQIEAKIVEVERAEASLLRVQDRISTMMAGLVNDPRINMLPNSEEVIARIKEITKAFLDGTLSLEEMNSKIRELPISVPAINAVIQSARTLLLELDSNVLMVKTLKNELDLLQGKQINVQVNVDVNDPFGILSRGLSSTEASKAQSGGFDAAETSRNNARLQQSILEKRRKEDAAILKRAVGDKGQQIEDRGLELFTDGMGRTREEARKLAADQINLEEATRNAGKAADSAAKDYEKFTDKIAELKEQGDAAFLSELDQKVVAFAKSLKDGSAMMRQYIEAVNSGDMSKAPDELREVREELLKIGAAGTWNEMLQKYGTGAQLAGKFADKQAELAIAMRETSMTAEQAALVYADFVTSFSNFEWINDLSSAFTDFAHSAITDFENIGDAAKSLLKRILDIIIQMTVLKPLEESLRSSLAQGATSGGGLGGFFSKLFGGGKASPLAAAAVASGAGVAFAAGGYTGPGGKYKPAGVVHAGEYVFDKDSTSRIGVGTLEAMQRGGMPGYAKGGSVLAAAREAIAFIESAGSGGYAARGNLTKKGDRAYGRYQVMGNNVRSWTKQALGRSLTIAEFRKNHAAQDAVFNHIFGNAMKRYGNHLDAASVWFTGGPRSKRSGRKKDINKMSGKGYVAKYLRAYNRFFGMAAPASKARRALNVGIPTARPGRFPAAPSGGFSLDMFPAAPRAPMSWQSPFVTASSADKGPLAYSGSGKGASFAEMERRSPAAAREIAAGGGGLYHSGGLVGSSSRFRPPGSKMLRDEVPAILRKGEVVASSVAQARQGDRGGMPVTIINRGAQVNAEKRVGGNGMPSLYVTVDNLLSDMVGRRGTRTNQVLDHGFGLKPAIKRVY